MGPRPGALRCLHCLLLLLLGMPGGRGGAAAPADLAVGAALPFKCKRSLDQLTSLKPKKIPKTRNCFMGAFEVTAAVLRPVVTGSTAALNLTVTLEPERDVRMMRYRLQLHSYTKNSTIDYKGDAGAGYSMCCHFVHGAECAWREIEGKAPTQEVLRCPLNEDLDEASRAAFEEETRPVVVGSVAKPLHHIAPGLWEATLWLLDGFGGAYGKVSAWTHVSEAFVAQAVSEALPLVLADAPVTPTGPGPTLEVPEPADPADPADDSEL